MTDKHTPGPWKITKAESGLQTVVHERGYAIPPDNIASIYWVNAGKATIRANARLIAAAPELLSALEYTTAVLAGVLDVLPPGSKASAEVQVEAARVAIKAAKGDA